jgi:diguanylate cyclase (GGDEF)-like protein
MAQDIHRQLERARRSLEKNKLREAVSEYQAILEEAPSNQEALQALADIYTRLNEPAQAAAYYAAQFDRLLDAGDLGKATAIFSRFLRPFPQSPDRLMRYATVLQRQNRGAEAIEHYSNAAELFEEQRRDIETLACRESIALLDSENPARHIALGEHAERLHHVDLAARSFLRAGQLTLAGGPIDEALEHFGRAQRLSPQDRTIALFYANAQLRKGDAEGAVANLEPLPPNEKDVTYLALFGEALLRTGRLDRAREVLEAYYKQKPESYVRIFELAGAFVQAGEGEKAASLLEQMKDSMRKARKESELVGQMDRLAASYPESLPLAEAVARIYEEMNRETKYFEALVRVFDLYLGADRLKEAREALERLVDIDPYDYRNQERIAKLEGKTDPVFLQNILARSAKASTVSARMENLTGIQSGISPREGVPAEGSSSEQALEDLLVQVEIFLQYSLQTKALERLQRVAELYPGEEARNERLFGLYQRANWWPNGAPPKQAERPIVSASSVVENPPVAPAAMTAAETHRDLAAIGEINRLMYRQPTPREVLGTTAAAIARHLGVMRCLVAVGGAENAGQLTSEYSAPELAAAGTARISSIVGMVATSYPDSLGGIELQAATAPALRELGLESALGVILTDKETQAPAGALLVGDTVARKWKPNESFFLQAVGDQLAMSVTHTRLRSLVRSLAVADEKTGILSRVAYIDCLLMESNRARSQGTVLSLLILDVDRGGEILRQYGDALFDRYIDQLARALCATIRQTDVAVKYSAWSLVFILPDTSLENAQKLAEKLRTIAASVRPPWGDSDLTFSALAVQASSRPLDEIEDSVTEWINRAEFGLEELRQGNGNSIESLVTP